MGDEQGFLQAIAAEPDNDGLRLIYADWLEDRGDPRCELVRVCQAMREVPVWSNRYWELKARRNELWVRCPLPWLEATGYDGGYYDPVFRDGVPDGWRERWRLIREFTERWHGVAVPDVGGRPAEVWQAAERLGLELPPSLEEYVAYAHDLRDRGTPIYDLKRTTPLFPCAFYQLDHLYFHPAISLIYYTLNNTFLGVAHEDLDATDPRTYIFSQASDDFGSPMPCPQTPAFYAPSLSLAIFLNLFIEFPTAGTMVTTRGSRNDLLARLDDDFPIHARLDDADIYETREMLVLVCGPTSQYGGCPERRVKVIVRQPVPVESVPAYLFGTDDRNTASSGMLGPEWFRRQQEAEQQRPGAQLPPRWTSPLRREAEQSRETAGRARQGDNPFLGAGRSPLGDQPPSQDVPRSDGGDDIPF